eukprot:3602494-Rhodomonas_salina.6
MDQLRAGMSGPHIASSQARRCSLVQPARDRLVQHHVGLVGIHLHRALQLVVELRAEADHGHLRAVPTRSAQAIAWRAPSA